MGRGGYRFDTVRVNINALNKFTKDSGYSALQVSNILGIAKGSYRNWKTSGKAKADTIKRVAKLFNIPVENLILQDTDVVQDVVPTSVTSLKTIHNVQNIHDIFEILNSNIFTLASMIEDIRNINTSTYDKLSAELSAIKMSMPGTVIEPEVVEGNIPEKPVAFFINEEEMDKLISGFDAADSYTDYKQKINRMVSIISTYKKTTHKSVLHSYYKEMTDVYGVVYDQLKKDYFNKYLHKAEGGSLELLYEEPIFRQIFYNIISDKLVAIRKEYVSK